MYMPSDVGPQQVESSSNLQVHEESSMDTPVVA